MHHTRRSRRPALLASSAALVAAFTVAGCVTPPEPAPGVKVEVAFESPEKFTDVKTGALTTDAARDATLAALRDYVERAAAPRLPADTTLRVTFTDIDRAGDYEPWRGAALADVRIIKPIYPPRIDLEFKLVDSTGAVLREGRRQLTDLTFQSRIGENRLDDLRYEKDLLGDWLRREFPVKR